MPQWACPRHARGAGGALRSAPIRSLRVLATGRSVASCAQPHVCAGRAARQLMSGARGRPLRGSTGPSLFKARARRLQIRHSQPAHEGGERRFKSSPAPPELHLPHALAKDSTVHPVRCRDGAKRTQRGHAGRMQGARWGLWL